MKSDIEATDFVVNEQEDFFFSALLTFLKKKKLMLQADDQELEFAVEFEQHDAQIRASFTYEYENESEKV